MNIFAKSFASLIAVVLTCSSLFAADPIKPLAFNTTAPTNDLKGSLAAQVQFAQSQILPAYPRKGDNRTSYFWVIGFIRHSSNRYGFHHIRIDKTNGAIDSPNYFSYSNTLQPFEILQSDMTVPNYLWSCGGYNSSSDTVHKALYAVFDITSNSLKVG